MKIVEVLGDDVTIVMTKKQLAQTSTIIEFLVTDPDSPMSRTKYVREILDPLNEEYKRMIKNR